MAGIPIPHSQHETPILLCLQVITISSNIWANSSLNNAILHNKHSPETKSVNLNYNFAVIPSERNIFSSRLSAHVKQSFLIRNRNLLILFIKQKKHETFLRCCMLVDSFKAQQDKKS